MDIARVYAHSCHDTIEFEFSTIQGLGLESNHDSLGLHRSDCLCLMADAVYIFQVPHFRWYYHFRCSLFWSSAGYHGSHLQLACWEMANLIKQHSLEQKYNLCWSSLDVPCTACVKAQGGGSRQSGHKKVRLFSSCPHCQHRLGWQRKQRNALRPLRLSKCRSGSALVHSKCPKTLAVIHHAFKPQ